MRSKDQKIAFITGAASGIGRATAELFAERGWWIGAADWNIEGLEALRDALGAAIEFDSLRAILRDHPPAGVTGPVPAYGKPFAITDDTQMCWRSRETVEI